MDQIEKGPVHYRMVAGESRFTVQAFAEGLLSAFGHDPVIAIRDFTGDVQFTPGTLTDGLVKMTIKADSLAANEDVKEKDRAEIDRMMHEDVLETAKFPEIVFTSTSVNANRLGKGRYRARVIGDLTLHGVTQNNIWIQAEVTITEEKVRAQGQFSLRQTDFQIKPIKVAGGTLKVKNELKFDFDIGAIADSGMREAD
jgi:polyisoprenoid-binding protein YceI